MAVSMTEAENIQDTPRAPYSARKSGSVQKGKKKKIHTLMAAGQRHRSQLKELPTTQVGII